ncbi:MAG: hypothetical protein IPM16_22170 [Chloroflexi bacterium]|nr:hypothetical protein [Chloroflexota bacterium]
MAQSTLKYPVLFTFWGIPVTLGRQAWQFVVSKLVFGAILAVLFHLGKGLGELIVITLGYTLIIHSFPILHTVGHVISSKRVQPPMTELRVIPLAIQTRYSADPDQLAPTVHLNRALGGPIMNLVLGALGLIWWASSGSHYAVLFTVGNLFFAFGALLPIPHIDGEVIWREVRRARAARR